MLKETKKIKLTGYAKLLIAKKHYPPQLKIRSPTMRESKGKTNWMFS